MGREVRRVSADWQHPQDGTYSDGTTRFKGLMSGYRDAAKEFVEMAEREGLQAAVEYFGQAPDANDYMPDWPEAKCTHYMMYETCSEGSPISPAFATPEELARWLADTGASAFGSQTADYEHWLRVARGGYACSAVYTPETGLISGVAASLG